MFTDPAWLKTDANGPAVGGVGLLLEKVAPECQDILQWPNGAIAAGVRPLGKGKVITLGTCMPWWTAAGRNCCTGVGWSFPPRRCRARCRTARWVSNNGLYDVSSSSRNPSRSLPPSRCTIPGIQTAMRDLRTGATLTGTARDGKVAFDGIRVEPLETYAFIAPRRLSEVPLEWFTLQLRLVAGHHEAVARPEAQAVAQHPAAE